MNWEEIRKKIYYVDDDYIRDVISFHLQDGAWDSIYKHIPNNTLFHIKDDMNLEKNSDAIITIFFKDFPLLRWYLNNEKILEMDIDARFVNSESVHLSICKFFTDISDLLSNDIYIVDDIIREHPLVLMEFIPMKTPKVLKHIKYLDM